MPASTESNLLNPDKEQLLADILAMRVNGMSYREIGRMVAFHWQETHIQHYVESHYRALERMLDLGSFQNLLPIELRRQTVVE